MRAIIYMCDRGIHFVSFYDFAIGFGIVPTVWYFLVFILYPCLLYWYICRGNKVGQTISENIHSHYFRVLYTYFIFRRDIFLTGVSRTNTTTILDICIHIDIYIVSFLTTVPI